MTYIKVFCFILQKPLSHRGDLLHTVETLRQEMMGAAFCPWGRARGERPLGKSQRRHGPLLVPAPGSREEALGE